jgi:hypothetical protein
LEARVMAADCSDEERCSRREEIAVDPTLLLAAVCAPRRLCGSFDLR